jgi:hypothetical protein
LLNAQNAVSTSPENKKTFQVLAEDVFDRFRGLFPNPGCSSTSRKRTPSAALYNLLQKAEAQGGHHRDHAGDSRRDRHALELAPEGHGSSSRRKAVRPVGHRL